jgi:hypothetical protein
MVAGNARASEGASWQRSKLGEPTSAQGHARPNGDVREMSVIGLIATELVSR